MKKVLYISVLILACCLESAGAEATSSISHPVAEMAEVSRLMLPHISIWSGREQTLPFQARTDWKLETEHGRLLASSAISGSVKINFPKLKGMETAVLSVDGKAVACIDIQPPNLLEGITASLECHQEKLQQLGMKQIKEGEPTCCFMTTPSMAGKDFFSLDGRFAFYSTSLTIVIFTDKWDFPMKLPTAFSSMTMGGPSKDSSLSIIFDKQEQLIDNSGGKIPWIIIEQSCARKFIILPPEFDLDNIDNILFLKKELAK